MPSSYAPVALPWLLLVFCLKFGMHSVAPSLISLVDQDKVIGFLARPFIVITQLYKRGVLICKIGLFIYCLGK